MRIRKNKNLSSLLLLHSSSGDDDVPTHFCRLNQSPWDVIPFSSYPYHHHSQQFGRDDNGSAARAGCSSAGSIAQVDSEEKPAVGFGGKGCKAAETIGESSGAVQCAKTDGKLWKCKREAKEGHHFCEHHVLQLKSYGRTVERGERAWAVGKKKNDDSSSPGRSSQYYYYSGFGPSWRKKRESTASRIANEGNSCLHLDEESESELEDEDEEGDRKRARKPVKARSLSSL